MRIRAKILIPALGLLMAGIMMVGAAGIVISARSNTKSAKELIVYMAESIRDRIDAWMVARTEQISVWSHQPVFVDALGEGFMATMAQAQADIEIKAIIENIPHIESMSLLDIQGQVKISSTPDDIGSRLGEDAFFKKAMQGQTVVSEAFISKTMGLPVIRIAGPVMDKTGTIRGVLVNTIKLNMLSELYIDTVKTGEYGYAYLLDQTGLVIAHPVKKHVLNLKAFDLPFGNLLRPGKGLADYKFEGQSKLVALSTCAETGWIVGVSADHRDINASAWPMGITIAGITFLVLMITAVIMSLITRAIIQPIRKTADMIRDISEGDGDLTKRLNVTSQDEIGEMARYFNQFIEKLQGIISSTMGNARTVDSSSKDLAAVSAQMTTNAGNTAERSHTVAAAAEEMTTNTRSVSAAMEEAAANIQMVVAAAEEMTATIHEIANNTAKGNSITQSAVTTANEVSQKINRLDGAAKDIGKVTETIADISEQTNLLALNATIEAARAGNAGKGFAVVAQEIKALAQQTAHATNEINTRISDVQITTVDSVEAINRIVQVINEINEIMTTVATAIEEQSVTTREISNNLAQAASVVNEANDNMTQISEATTEVTRNIVQVNQDTDQMNTGSVQVNTSAKQLSKLAAELNDMLGRFKI